MAQQPLLLPLEALLWINDFLVDGYAAEGRLIGLPGVLI
jgi:hypothetical protein